MSAQTETKTKEVAVENNYNKWSVELAGGLNKPMRPMTAGYRLLLLVLM
jgi:OOP family OmpA-OmpF porin